MIRDLMVICSISRKHRHIFKLMKDRLHVNVFADYEVTSTEEEHTVGLGDLKTTLISGVTHFGDFSTLCVFI